MSIAGIPEMKESYRKLGPRKFWAITISTLSIIFVYALLTLWLYKKVGWPERYGFHCSGHDCLIADLWHSPALLSQPDGYHLGLFALIWSLPAFVVGCVIYPAVKKRRARTYL